MSKERGCFKKMSQLVKEKGEFEFRYFETGEKLVREALVEFMADHPEVDTLNFQVEPSSFVVYVSGNVHTAKSLAQENEKLSACLLALESNFMALSDVVLSVYGESVVTVTHKNVLFLGGM